MKMRHLSMLSLLVFAFVVLNLLIGISFNSGSREKSSGELDGRRLKERSKVFNNRMARGMQTVRTDDYQPVDPSPSSKANIKPGPIEHGTPLLPYVPRYAPPPPEEMPSAQSPASPIT